MEDDASDFGSEEMENEGPELGFWPIHDAGVEFDGYLIENSEDPPWTDDAGTSYATIGGSASLGMEVDVNLNLDSRGDYALSSSSSSMISARGENFDRDPQNKRFKVHSFMDLGINTMHGEVVDKDLDFRMDLTDDLLHKVFSLLDHTDICRAAMVCRQWRDASYHEDFWRFLNFENRFIFVQQFEDICLRYPNATAVNVYGTPSINILVMKAVSLLRNIQVLTLGKGCFDETFFQALTGCHMLKSLTVKDATLGSDTPEIPINHDSLLDLQLVRCRVLRISIRCPKLGCLSLKRSTMSHAVLSCPLLHELDIAACHKLSDVAIRSAVTSCPLLELLDMSTVCVSDETLREIALTCRSLHSLDASYCRNISLESVRLPMLKVLKLHSCEGITSASMVAVAYCYMLEILELDNCCTLTSVSLDLPRLESIRLVHCRKLAVLYLQSNVLSSIAVRNCPSVEKIDITSNALKQLVLHKQEKLATLALECHCLLEVKLTECEALMNSICKVFSNGGGCPVLRSLILDSCESLTAVSFFSTSLVSLSLGGCHAITSLELKCPRLEHLLLDGCNHLEKASFSPVGLRSLNLGICPRLNVLHVEAPMIISLELKGCGVLSEAFFDCPVLTSLDASFCSQLNDHCLSAATSLCPLIESLVLMSCPSVGPDGLSSLQGLQLIYLDLSYTFLVDLQPVFDFCMHLKVLKLQACKYLSDTSLEPLHKGGALPALCELDLSYGTLCQLAMEELLAGCVRLTHVSLNGCVNMHDLDWGFDGDRLSEIINSHGPLDCSFAVNVDVPNEQPNRLLQNLNCVGCPNIRKVVVPHTARCFHLSALNLSLSSNLKEVDISCCNLSFLNLSNCSSLEILKLDCPRLTSLSLQSCNIDVEAVEAAIVRCDVLETLDVRFCPKISSPLSMGTFRSTYPSLKRIFSSSAQT